MSAYHGRVERVYEDGYVFDSRLERDWAGWMTHLGFVWRKEPFAILREPGQVSTKNVIARPDFLLPEIAAIVECKPTMKMLEEGRDRWRDEAARTGLPVLVTAGPPQPIPRTNGLRLPPLLMMLRPGCVLPDPVFLTRCMDCDRGGIFRIPWVDGLEPLWISACRHPAPEMRDVVTNGGGRIQ